MKQELLPILWNVLSKTKGDESQDSESRNCFTKGISFFELTEKKNRYMFY